MDWLLSEERGNLDEWFEGGERTGRGGELRTEGYLS
jgi:hypothetical protein